MLSGNRTYSYDQNLQQHHGTWKIVYRNERFFLLTSEGEVVSVCTTNFNTTNTVLFPYNVHIAYVLFEPCSKQLSFLQTRLTDRSFKWTRTVLC